MNQRILKPSIKFKGFDGEWVRKKVKEFGEIITGKTPNTKNKSYWNGEIPFITPTDINNKYSIKTERYLTKEGSLNSKCIPKNSVLITCIASIGKNTITTTWSTFNQQINAIISNNLYNFEFLYYLFEKSKNLLINESSSSATDILNKEQFSNLFFFIPSLREQQKISMFFSNLDSLITFHQNKYDKLKKIKKALLEKMFPVGPKKIPKLRFKGFTDAWEQCKLWSLTTWDKNFNEVENYKQPKIIKYKYVLADIFNQIEDSFGEVRLLSTGSYIGYTSMEKANKYLCEGEIVAIPWGGVPNVKYFCGKFVTADNRIATSNNKSKLSNKYLYLWFKSKIKQLESIYRGASIKHPSMSDILDFDISLPQINEQKKISDLFFILNNLITLHQRKCEKLKIIKKSLLERMFV